MALNPGAGRTSWNCTKPDREDYSLEMTGTVVAMQEVQARDYNPSGTAPGAPRFWPDGNPVWNIRVAFAMADGSLRTVTFPEAGKAQQSGQKPSLHMQLFGLSNGSMGNLIGKTIHLWTWPANPETGQAWGKGNPRLFGVEEVPDVKYELAAALPAEFNVPKLLCNDGASGGQPTPAAPQQIQVPQMHGNFYAAPTAQYQPMPQQYQQPMVQQYQQPMQQYPQYQQPMPQPMPQYQQQAPQQYQQPMPQYQQPAIQAMPPQSAPMPNGMDPAVAAAMQAAGAVNVQPVGSGSIYDDIPF